MPTEITITVPTLRRRAYIQFIRQSIPDFRVFKFDQYAQPDVNNNHTTWNETELGPEPTAQDLMTAALTLAKNGLIGGLKNRREEHESEGLDLGGGQFDLSRSALAHLAGMLSLGSGKAGSTPVAWPKKDGTYVNVTMTQLRNAAAQIFDHINKGQILEAQLQAQIDTMVDFPDLQQVVDAINAFDISAL